MAASRPVPQTTDLENLGQLSGKTLAGSSVELSGLTPAVVEVPCSCQEGAAADDSAGPQPAAPKGKQPLVEWAAPFTGEAPLDLGPLVQAPLGGAFSLMCSLRMDGVEDWARLFDFSAKPDDDSITAGAVECTDNFHFTVFKGSKPVSVLVKDFFELGKEATVLCTVSASGHMKVFKDGLLVGENPHGAAPAPIERSHLIVGSHFHFTNQAFRGRLANLKVWDQEVPWHVSAKVDGWDRVVQAPPPPMAEACVDSTAAPDTDNSAAHSDVGSDAGSVLLLDPSQMADSEDGSEA